MYLDLSYEVIPIVYPNMYVMNIMLPDNIICRFVFYQARLNHASNYMSCIDLKAINTKRSRYKYTKYN